MAPAGSPADAGAPGAAGPVLIDSRSGPSFRAVFGRLAARSRAIEVAVRRIRLSAVDLRRREMAGLRVLRILIGQIDTGSLASEAGAVAADTRKRANLLVLLEMLDAGIIEVRASALLAWAPDFSVFHDERGPRRLLIGAHAFQRPRVPGSVALASLHGEAAAWRASARFAELWADGRDLRPAILEILERAAVRPPSLRETAMRAYGTPASPADAAAVALARAFAAPVPDAEAQARAGAADSDPGTEGRGDARRSDARRSQASDLTAYQRDAAERAGHILARRRGVLICDSVGLGKTFIALRLIEDALLRGGRVAVVSPAALRHQWTAPLAALAHHLALQRTIGLGRGPSEGAGGRWHTGRLELADADAPHGVHGSHDPRPRGDPLLAWLSQARLSRGSHRPERIVPLDLLVVDEAHNFRNPGTRRYAALAALAAGAHVALLTATPVNNSAWDLYWLIRLFAGDGDFADLGVPSLREAVDAAHRAAASLRPVVAAISVRRTRTFIRDHYGAGDAGDAPLPLETRSGHGGPAPLRFPARAPPVAIRYSLEEARAGWYGQALAALDALEFAALSAAALAGDGTRTRGRRHRRPGGRRRGAVDPRGTGDLAAPVELMRLGLLKRLESSIFAFGRSVARQIRMARAVQAALGDGRVPGAGELRALVAGDESGQLLLAPVIGWPLPQGADPQPFQRAIGGDLERLERLRAIATPIDARADPKLARLVRLLAEEIPGEKVAVFTEFRDTARYIHRALCGRARVALVDGESARVGDEPASRREVIARFAPRANGARPPRAAERVDVLVATDVLSEGLNLQDAGRVVSYDLPWNPVRLIQRIGRIDRLGSLHELVHLYHFLPDAGLEPMLRLFARIRAKLATIGETIGTDGLVLGDEPPLELDAVLDALARDGPACLERIERAGAAPFEIEERIRLRWQDSARRGEPRRSEPRQPGGADEPVVAAAADRNLAGLTALCFRAEPEGQGWEDRWVVADEGGARLDRIAALQAFTRALDAEPAPMDRERLDHAIAQGLALLSGPESQPRVTRRGPEARALQRLDQAVAAMRGEPDAELCRRIDRIAPILARPLPIGLARRVSELLANQSDPRALLAALELVLSDRAGREEPAEPAPWRLVAAVQFSA